LYAKIKILLIVDAFDFLYNLWYNLAMISQELDAIVLLNEDNRYFCSNLNTSFGAVILTHSKKVYITDNRYEYFLKQNLAGWTIVTTNGNQLFQAIAKECLAMDAKTIGYEDDTILKSQYDVLQSELQDGIKLVPSSQFIKQTRATKNAEMIEYIAEAQRISEKTLSKIIPTIKSGVTEREISARIDYEMILAGATSPSFDTIVAFGENSAKPHHHPSYKEYEKGDIILIDMGAKYNGYCSDMTRTFCLSECANKELITIHGIVVEAQKYALKNIKPGMQCCEVDAMCREYIRSNGYEKEFSHSTGHGVGINIHEYPAVSANSQEILQEGMVITIEPGIYVKGLGGVRMEDIVVLTQTGIRNLTSFSKNFYTTK